MTIISQFGLRAYTYGQGSRPDRSPGGPRPHSPPGRRRRSRTNGRLRAGGGRAAGR